MGALLVHALGAVADVVEGVGDARDGRRAALDVVDAGEAVGVVVGVARDDARAARKRLRRHPPGIVVPVGDRRKVPVGDRGEAVGVWTGSRLLARALRAAQGPQAGVLRGAP
ncbi:MAG TPA: hypothetical protein VLA89_17505, partial [Gemmatimonadales bacterium]|nr:hypothetical protein [Gemmatimonadales bacterium]